MGLKDALWRWKLASQAKKFKEVLVVKQEQLEQARNELKLEKEESLQY
eukprot:CAMPEP_0202979674 /NCGR_PEP_ID=MMETSP1396-20130829/85764_1 /ASSEMBLY_ACC=CAM_ASM_000872 /TAXON_ID= /ORGANISM="Pseudokeronopsis sp., Strain Brazil" /LENGTH=47 /DNA_ID= /DNA_START= /DNA_END= /DNA_ORIENTATION=